MGDSLDSMNLGRIGLYLGGISALWVLTGRLKSLGFGREGDVRKINHVAGYTAGAFLFGWLPEPEARASLYLAGLGLLLLVAVACAWRHVIPFRYAFAANTRVADHPWEAFYFWSSWLSSIAGLMAIDLALGSFQVVRTAALVVGIADGIAEPVGRRFGYHPYRRSSRTLEGSASVLLGTLFVLALFTTAGEVSTPMFWLLILGTAAFVTTIEAVSPRGSDNFTIAVGSGVILKGMHQMGWIVFR